MSRKTQRKRLVLFGLAVVTLAAIAHAYQLVLEFRIIEDAPHANRVPAQLQLFLLLAFLMIAMGLLIRPRIGLVCSVFGLIIVFLGHVWWLYYSYAVLYAINYDGLYERHPDLRPQSLFGFAGARWWDVVLLVLFIALLVWEIKMLFTRAENRNRNDVGSLR